MVLCADYYKFKVVSVMHDESLEISEVENLLMGAVDTALVVQNIIMAAEFYRLGGVMIDGI